MPAAVPSHPQAFGRWTEMGCERRGVARLPTRRKAPKPQIGLSFVGLTFFQSLSCRGTIRPVTVAHQVGAFRTIQNNYHEGVSAMKKMLGVAAAALLLSAGAAAAAPTSITATVHTKYGDYSCTVLISKANDVAHGISSKALLAANSSGCGFVGIGTIGKIKFSKTDNAARATIGGTSSLLGTDTKLLFVLDYPFVTGGHYWAYSTTDGQNVTYGIDGTYTVN
jgi:hypothetical protein